MGHERHKHEPDNCEILAAIQHAEKRIMSAISDFAAKQNAHNDAMDKAIEGITGDVAFLKGEIERLQNTGGVLTADDQAIVDALEARTGALAEKLGALDALTPPVPPVEESKSKKA